MLKYPNHVASPVKIVIVIKAHKNIPQTVRFNIKLRSQPSTVPGNTWVKAVYKDKMQSSHYAWAHMGLVTCFGGSHQVRLKPVCWGLSIFGPRREKTCLRGFCQSELQTTLLSYRLAFTYDTFVIGNNKGADQTVRKPRLVCACVVCKPPKTGFLPSRPIWFIEFELPCILIKTFTSCRTKLLVYCIWNKYKSDEASWSRSTLFSKDGL